MEKKVFNIREIFNLSNLLVFLITFFGQIVLIFILYFIMDNKVLFIDTGLDFVPVYLENSLFVTAILGIGISGLSFITNEGTFDIIVVGFANLSSVFQKDSKKRYEGLFEYREIKESKRHNKRFRPLFYLLSGIIYLIIFIIIKLYLY